MSQQERPPAIDAALVNDFVLNAHGNFARVKELLAQEPMLVNAVWDWGGGDYESALGAAAHTGGKEIAEYLLTHGARIDLFTAAMLGQLAVVQAVLTAFPAALHVPGPHGIPLLAHAKVGGAEAVVSYLEGVLANA